MVTTFVSRIASPSQYARNCNQMFFKLHTTVIEIDNETYHIIGCCMFCLSSFNYLNYWNVAKLGYCLSGFTGCLFCRVLFTNLLTYRHMKKKKTTTTVVNSLSRYNRTHMCIQDNHLHSFRLSVSLTRHWSACGYN